MIPILYDKNETAFSRNGLGRLRDAISATVTEERNGIYECSFEYPVDGVNYDLIQIGRIIGVTHDDSEDIQPFDITSYTRPINGIVTFHCTHLSYRQNYLTATGSNINSLSNAFALLSNAAPSNPFTYWTDKTSSGYLAAADGLPKTVRSLLGGVEGSILDVYGGEYEWDKWTVKLHGNRGEVKDFSIRYGVNMLNYNEDLDISGTYSSCIPYWTDGTNTIIGDRQDSLNPTVTGRGECVPLDVSDRFDSKPTKAQVEAMGQTVMAEKDSTVPSQTIKVEFVRLQDMGYENLENLLACRLCDSINVVFPDYNTSSPFKIVKTVWNVLADRYDSMELGQLSTTLAEALGISSDNSSSSSGKIDFTKAYNQDNGYSVAVSSLAAGTYQGISIELGNIEPNKYPILNGINIYNNSNAARIHTLGHYVYQSDNKWYAYVKMRNDWSSAVTNFKVEAMIAWITLKG